MKARFAISKTKDPLKGRFNDVQVMTSQVVTVADTVYVDLRINVFGSPYVRVRMDIEAAEEIAHDMLAAATRARDTGQ